MSTQQSQVIDSPRSNRIETVSPQRKPFQGDSAQLGKVEELSHTPSAVSTPKTVSNARETSEEELNATTLLTVGLEDENHEHKHVRARQISTVMQITKKSGVQGRQRSAHGEVA